MALRIRRGTESQRTGQIFNSGEIVWTTDLQQLWVGDGVAQGGVPAVGLNIAGYGLTYNTGSHKIEVSGLTTDDITQIQGANNRWFTTELAQDAVAPMFTGGTHSNIEFQYDDALGKINATVTLDGAGLNSVQGDTAPTLGGNLALNTFNIEGTGDIDITGSITASSTITGSGLITDGTITASTGLGGDLSLNSHSITGTGSINMTGTVDADLTENVRFRQIVNGLSPRGFITSITHRGTFASPQAVVAGDELGGLLVKGYTDGVTSANAGIISFIVDETAVIDGGDYIKTFIALSASSDSTQDSDNALIIDSAGVTTSNAFVASKYTQLAVYADDAARDTAIPVPAAGMMVFMASGVSPAVSNKPIIFNGISWEAF